MPFRSLCGVAALLFAACCSIVRADIPRLLAVQGLLRNSAGAAEPDGAYPVVFRLYDAASGGNLLWQEPATGTENMTVAGGHGLFSAMLGNGVPLDTLSFSKPMWLGIQVGTDPEMTPRLPLTPAPYAIGIPLAGSGTAPTAAHSDHAHFGQTWSGAGPVGLIISNDTSNVSTGFPSGLYGSVTGPGTGVYGRNAASAGDTYGIYGEAYSPRGTGVQGNAFYGVHGSTFQANGIGVYGTGQTQTGSTIGVQGESSSPQGIGVYGANASAGNYGYVGNATSGVFGSASGATTYGVQGINGAGIGVYGTGATGLSASGTAYGVTANSTGDGSGVFANAAKGFGVWGQSSGSYGVYGTTMATDKSGIYGESGKGANAYGVFGTSASGTGVGGSGPKGVVGTNSSVSGNFGILGASYAGVEGISSNGAGVYGESSNFGVQGHNTVTGNYAYLCTTQYAGDFYGDVDVRGTLTKTAGSFKIDHPLDPEHKYLLHSFVESPDMKNIYDGVVTLDEHGEAVVTLPDWFEALNMDFRYQLTAIGAPGPNLYIAQKVTNNRFRIAGGTPGLEVSWQVTGIRHDTYANTHRIPVEEWKTGNAVR